MTISDHQIQEILLKHKKIPFIQLNVCLYS